jgi:hypothetical protein
MTLGLPQLASGGTQRPIHHGNGKRCACPTTAASRGVYPDLNVRFCRIFAEIPARLQDTMKVKNQRFGLRISGLLFAVFSIAHLLRLFLHVDVRIAGREIAMWPSWVAAFVAGALSIWLLSLSNRVERT